MAAKVLYKSSIAHDLKKIALKDRQRILRQIEEELGGNPRSSESLHGEFDGLLKLRVGEYRVVYALVGADVLVLRIRHRSKAYG